MAETPPSELAAAARLPLFMPTVIESNIFGPGVMDATQVVRTKINQVSKGTVLLSGINKNLTLMRMIS
ncbi:hypothetical protein [Kiloniella sp.]|uniref:hypothetical protein n=1 Tax=Kiloniella sp. TaxID=1938587 RepID=UPI003B01C5A0